MAHKPLKLWFDRDLAQLLAHKISDNGAQLDTMAFIHVASQGLDDLELKARVEHMADVLHQHLSFDYKENIAALLGILGPENEKETGMFKEF